MVRLADHWVIQFIRNMRKVEKKNQFKTFRASLFNEDLSNDPNPRQIIIYLYEYVLHSAKTSPDKR
jgi:hypothetical protein